MAKQKNTVTNNVVYFIGEGPGHPVRIGTTNDLDERLAYHQSSYPEELKVLATLPGNTTLENIFHRNFDAHKTIVGGQTSWYRWHDELAQVIDPTMNNVSEVAITHDDLRKTHPLQWLNEHPALRGLGITHIGYFGKRRNYRDLEGYEAYDMNTERGYVEFGILNKVFSPSVCQQLILAGTGVIIPTLTKRDWKPIAETIVQVAKGYNEQGA